MCDDAQARHRPFAIVQPSYYFANRCMLDALATSERHARVAMVDEGVVDQLEAIRRAPCVRLRRLFLYPSGHRPDHGFISRRRTGTVRLAPQFMAVVTVN
jgi:hypothetical protein